MQKKLEEARQEKEWRLCAASPIYFVNKYCYMWEKAGGAPIDWQLWPCQEDALSQMMSSRLLIFLKVRQLGLSWVADAYVLWKSLFGDNMHSYFRSIGLIEAVEQHERIKFMYDFLPEWMQLRVELGGKRRKRNDRKSQFSNRSSISMIASSKRSGHGSAPTVYVWDEAARDENDTYAMRAILPAVGDQAQLIIISTANGFGNVYEELWHQAYNGDSNFKAIFYGVDEHPLYTEEFLARKKLDYLGDPVGYAEAYPKTPEDAFLASAKCPFDSDRIKESIAYINENNLVPESGILEYDDKNVVQFKESGRGKLFVWKHPIAKRFNHLKKDRSEITRRDRQYVIGADVAEGLTGGDFSAAVVVDSETMEVVALLRGKWPPEHYGWLLEMTARYYNNAWLAVEVNKNADALIGDLKRTYHMLYCRERKEKLYDKPTMEPGFYTSGRNKNMIITGLRKAFHSVSKPLYIYSLVVLNEMSTYEEQDGYKYGASGNNYDDTVMALAIALEALKTMPEIDDYVPSRRPDWRSM